MSKKEFYETYIKDNRTEDEKMMDIIHENAQKRKDDKVIKKEHKALEIAVYVSKLILLFVLGVLVGSLWMK